MSISSTSVLPTKPAVTVTAAPTLTLSATSIPNTAPILTPTHPSSNLSNPRVAVLADNLPGPDDLALGADGSIYISDVSDRTVKQYTPDGKLRVVYVLLLQPLVIAVLF